MMHVIGGISTTVCRYGRGTRNVMVSNSRDEESRSFCTRLNWLFAETTLLGVSSEVGKWTRERHQSLLQ